VEEQSCTPAEPSENVTRNLKPPTGFTEVTSIIGACDAEAAAVRLRMMPVLHQLGMPKFPIFVRLKPFAVQEIAPHRPAFFD
jgi:hypothetical protein